MTPKRAALVAVIALSLVLGLLLVPIFGVEKWGWLGTKMVAQHFGALAVVGVALLSSLLVLLGATRGTMGLNLLAVGVASGYTYSVELTYLRAVGLALLGTMVVCAYVYIRSMIGQDAPVRVAPTPLKLVTSAEHTAHYPEWMDAQDITRYKRRQG